jgi:hypothetical protein
MATATAKVTINTTVTMMTSIPTTTISTMKKKPSAGGIPKMRGTFLPASRRRISSLQDWKSNWCVAANFPWVCRNVSSRVPKNCSGGFLLRHLTA